MLEKLPFGSVPYNAISIQAGTLVANGHGAGLLEGRGINGNPDSPLSIESGGTLGGEDFVKMVATVKAGGHLAPGSPVGLGFTRPEDTITGYLAFHSGLTLEAGAQLDRSLASAQDRYEQ